MAAYAAAVSLAHILDLIKNHPSPPISFDKQQLHSLTQLVDFLQEFLEGYVSPYSYSDEADPFEMRIAETVYAAEDVIESYIVDNIHHGVGITHDDSDVDDDDNDSSDDDDDDDDDDDEEEEEEGDYISHDDIMESYIVDNIHLAAPPSTAQDDNDDDNDDDDEEGRDNDEDDDDDDDEEEEEEEGDYSSHATSTTQDDDDDGDDDDAIELYTLDSIKLAAAAAHYEDEQIRYINFYQGLQKVIEVMDFIKKEAMEMAVDKGRLPEAEAEVQRNVSAEAGSKSRSIETKIEMVGFEDELLHLKERLVGGNSNREIVPIVGMGGIGKTTLARNVFIDKLIEEHFDICLWATISQDYNIEQTLIEVLSQYQGRGYSSGEKKSVAELGQELHKYLFGRRYLVVLDDMWSIEVWDKMRFFFPECGEGSRVIVTTRMSNLAAHLTNSSNNLCMSFLNEVDSWTLFSKTVFGSEGSNVSDVQFELRGIGEKIVGKCKGLPLSIAVIGGLLAKSERTQGYWEYIEENLSSIVNLENEEYCLRVLKLSYNHLPAYLKPCFLYMGVFDEDSEIEVSTIINLWVSEGFLKPRKTKNLEAVAWEYFQELVDRNLLLPHKSKPSDWQGQRELGWVGKNIKWCKMHDLVRDVSLRESQKQRFYYVHRHKDEDCPSSEHHRRIVIPGETTRDGYQPRTRLEYSWPYSRSYVCHDDDMKQVPNFRLLRTLHTSYNGSGVRSHQYRLKDVLGLVNSRLLAICLRGGWPEIGLHSSMLWSLQTLIVRCSHVELEGPVEFWRMHQLKQVVITFGRLHLPLPPNNDDDDIVILENLHTLIGVKDFHLNEDVVTRIPNLRMLDVFYSGYDLNREVHSLSYLRHLSKLESFRCIIAYESDVDLQLICFPPSLKEIVLVNYSSYPRVELEDVLQKIGQLPLVEELMIFGTLCSCWETVEGQFPMLKRLELERCHGLEKWTVPEASHFPLLEKLILKELEELEEVPSAIGDIATLRSIQLNNCGESAVLSAKRIVEEQEDLYGEDELSFRVLVKSRDAAALSLASPNFQVEVR